MPKLAVNIDHVATLRQARGGKNPDPIAAAVIAELAGADGIIVHLREDRRHIQDRDLDLLRKVIKTKLNLEMANTEAIMRMALQVKPDLAHVCARTPGRADDRGRAGCPGQSKSPCKRIYPG